MDPTTLTQFDDNGDEQGGATDRSSQTSTTGGTSLGGGIAQRANFSDPPDEVYWGPVGSEYGLTTCRIDSGIPLSGEATETTTVQNFGQISTTAVRWITGGNLAEYVDTNAEQRLQIPKSYSGMDGWAYIPRADASRGAFGVGLDQSRLEPALRILTGGGRYTASEYSLVGCGPHKPAVLASREGAVLIEPGPTERVAPAGQRGLSQTELAVDFARGDSQTYQIYEDNEAVREGLRRFLRGVEEYFLSGDYDSDPDTYSPVVELENTSSDGYLLATADQENGTIHRDESISGAALELVGESHADVDTVGLTEEMTIATPVSTDVTVCWDPSKTGKEVEQPILGHFPHWRVDASGRYITFTVSTLTLRHSTFRGFQLNSAEQHLATVTLEDSLNTGQTPYPVVQ